MFPAVFAIFLHFSGDRACIKDYVFIDAGSSTGNFSHFNLNDEMMNSQEWNTDFFPAADGYEYNYAYVNRTQCKDVYTIPEQMRAALDAR